MDALSQLLEAVRLCAGAFLQAEFTEPWSIRAQVGPEDCRTIFLDWALGQPGPTPEALAELLAHYGPRHPAHPMTAILRAASHAPPAPARRGGRKGRHA